MKKKFIIISLKKTIASYFNIIYTPTTYTSIYRFQGDNSTSVVLYICILHVRTVYIMIINYYNYVQALLLLMQSASLLFFYEVEVLIKVHYFSRQKVQFRSSTRASSW